MKQIDAAAVGTIIDLVCVVFSVVAVVARSSVALVASVWAGVGVAEYWSGPPLSVSCHRLKPGYCKSAYKGSQTYMYCAVTSQSYNSCMVVVHSY